MNDSKPPKTLTLKRPQGQGSDEAKPGSARKRAGARARQAIQREREEHQQRRQQKAKTVGARQASAEPGSVPAPAEHNGTLASRERDSRPAVHGRHPEQAPAPRARTQRQSKSAEARAAEVFNAYAPCPQGLEEALAAELEALGYSDVKTGRAGCSFRTDWTGVLRANLYSRLAARILVEIVKAPVSTEDDILELARSAPWERWFGPEHTLRLDTSAVRSPMQSLQYCNLRAKDGICDRLRDKEGARPSIDTVRPDARVHLFLDANTATLYLDTSGESLFKRGWRLDKGQAPLRENLAAGLLALSGWDTRAPLLDPFCGSGTILIEAAWIALGVPPGILRPFSFQRLRHHNRRLWSDIKEDAHSRIAHQLESPIAGYDLDPAVLEAARQNAARAQLDPNVLQLDIADARTAPAPAAEGWIVTNPPYGERMDLDEALWQDWASNLKRNYDGWSINVISSDLELPGKMRLKPLRRRPLYNGALECRLFSFDMVSSSYRKPTPG